MPRHIDVQQVVARVESVRKRVRELTERPVALVAVTKSFDVDAAAAAAGAGCDAIGENYAQELLAKAPDLPPGMPVHFIGRLQSNKVRSLMGLVDVWETVDRPSLAAEIGRRAGVTPARVLLQVNTTGEQSKSGCEPLALGGLLEASVAAGLSVEGLMTIGPTGASAEQCRESFRTLRRLADEHGLVHCSMGMSDDWETAVEEGSTIIRLGSALFGSRT
jgi:pyridoxal phosphate enzyme (YggS family)